MPLKLNTGGVGNESSGFLNLNYNPNENQALQGMENDIGMNYNSEQRDKHGGDSFNQDD